MTQAAEVGRKLTSLRPYTTNTANATELMSAQTIQCRDTCVTKACCARVQGDGCVCLSRGDEECCVRMQVGMCVTATRRTPMSNNNWSQYSQ